MFESAQKLTIAILTLAGMVGSAFADSMLAESLANTQSTLKIEKIDTSAAADLVLIDGGLRNGLRAGLLCTATTPDNKVGKIMVVDANLTKSAALVLGDFDIVEGSSVRFDLEK